MNLKTEKELEAKIGKPNFWSPQRLTNSCEYVAGLPDLDEKIGLDNFFKVKPIINFEKHPEGLGLKIMLSFKYHHCGVSNGELTGITIEKGDVVEVQERSVLGRALVGGLLLGPIGALIGGISGVKNKAIKDQDNLILSIKTENGEQAIFFQIKKGNTNEVLKFFRQHFGAKVTMS